MKAYSLDLRERILRAYLEGEKSKQKIARRFYVSRTFVEELIYGYYRNGSLLPKSKQFNKKDSDIRFYLRKI